MHDVAVVGAGPAGLAAGIAAQALGAKVLVIEQGKAIADRSQNNHVDVLSGIGGAGLYSDGKFSFFPSATALWLVCPYQSLQSAYEWISGILATAGLTAPPFPSRTIIPGERPNPKLQWKRYPSYYLEIDKRRGLLEALSQSLTGRLVTNQPVTRICCTPSGRVSIFGRENSLITEAHRVILAMGRLGALALSESLLPQELVYRRVELGVRIEQPSNNFFLANHPSLDPKLICDKGNGISWRTFCCCRDGLVMFTCLNGLSSVSGRADCPPTGRSNVGILVRFDDRTTGMAAWRNAVERQPIGEPVVEPVLEVISQSGRPRAESRTLDALGGLAARHVVEALRDLQDSAGMALTGAVLHAPAIEGVGLYPQSGRDLRVPGRPIFVAGDITGKFRGLTAALISGYVAGEAAGMSATRDSK